MKLDLLSVYRHQLPACSVCTYSRISRQPFLLDSDRKIEEKVVMQAMRGYIVQLHPANQSFTTGLLSSRDQLSACHMNISIVEVLSYIMDRFK